MSTCYRIDPKTGERTIVRKRSTPKTAARSYGLWNDLTQAWDGGPYPSLQSLAAAFYYEPGLIPMRWGGTYNPQQLTRAEWRRVQNLMEDAG